jgi:hypothetical protein
MMVDMALRNLRRHLTASTEELHHELLSDEWSARGTTPIASASARGRVRVGGEVQGIHVVSRAGSPSLEVTVHDGTGRAVAVFTGRSAIGGMTPSRKILLKGMAVRRGRRLELLNPVYTLLP